jgi:RNA polymerase sigma-70 factor, ECF subfamily
LTSIGFYLIMFVISKMYLRCTFVFNMNILEKDLCEKIKLGDEKAFEYIFKSYYALLCTYAFDLIRNDEQAEDLVQEVLIKVWENRSKIDIKTSLKSYLYRSVYNQCLNLLKHIRVVKKLENKYIEDTLLNVEFVLFTEETFTLDDYFYEGLERDIEEAIQSLPEQCRIIFQMSRFENLSYEEIARKLDISVNTVKTQMRRALEKLRTNIKKKIVEHHRSPDEFIFLILLMELLLS